MAAQRRRTELGDTGWGPPAPAQTLPPHMSLRQKSLLPPAAVRLISLQLGRSRGVLEVPLTALATFSLTLRAKISYLYSVVALTLKPLPFFFFFFNMTLMIVKVELPFNIRYSLRNKKKKAQI